MTLPYVNILNHVVDARISPVAASKDITFYTYRQQPDSKVSNSDPLSFNVTKIFNNTGLKFLSVIYQGNNTVVFRIDEESFIIPGADSELGKGIDVLTHYGYKLDQVVTSGMGSQGNPTRFYVIMSKIIPQPS